jgi:hypothetical protein
MSRRCRATFMTAMPSPRSPPRSPVKAASRAWASASSPPGKTRRRKAKGPLQADAGLDFAPLQLATESLTPIDPVSQAPEPLGTSSNGRVLGKVDLETMGQMIRLMW